MASVSVEKFLVLLRKSKLLSDGQLDVAQKLLVKKNNGKLPEKLKSIVQFYIDQKLLTHWQCEKLTSGKYRGFFLAKYKLLKLLGTGGMSSVYLAEHILMKRKVAIKVLPPRKVKDASYLARFQMEAEAIAQLDHKNIVRAFDIDQEESTHYIVMEYVPGRDLQAIVRETGPLSFDQSAQCILQAAQGLEHMHTCGLIHRDIKPANLLFDPAGIIKILDMGLARFSQDDEESLTVAHDENVLGTADYLSPEQAVNSHQVDARADIYSLGCTLYFLLVGHAPFPEGSLAQRIAKHQSVMPEKIRKFRPNCPASLEKICEKMMAKNVAERYQSATEVEQQIHTWLDSRGRGKETEKKVEGQSAKINSENTLPQAEPLLESEQTATEKLTLPRAEPLSDIGLEPTEHDEFLITGDSHILSNPRNSLESNLESKANKPNLPRAVALTIEEEQILAQELAQKNVQLARKTKSGNKKKSGFPVIWIAVGIVSLAAILGLFYMLSQ